MTPSDAVVALWALFILSWTVAALWVRRTTASMAGRPQLPLYAGGAAVAVAIGALGVTVPAMHARLWPQLVLLDWAMVAICAAGMAFCWWARIHLGHLWSAGVERREGHRVVDTGPYGIVRHPIYTGAILAALAFAAVRAKPMAILLALFALVFFSLKARLEERFLRQEFGAAYDEYARRVARLVPGWRR